MARVLLVRGFVFVALAIPTAAPAAQSSGSSVTTQPTSALAIEYDDPVAVCDLEDERITEASGLAASRRHPGLFYTHNDSGNAPDVFLIDRAGNTRLTIVLTGATNVDWEDIALAPGVDGAFDVCVADIGDNSEKRREIAIYRFAEPDLCKDDLAATSRPASRSTTTSASATARITASKFVLRYPDGSHNAESLAVNPRNGDAYILTKTLDGKTGIYCLAAPWATKATVTRVGTLRFPHNSPVAICLTAASVSPDGRRLAGRSYVCGWEWQLPAGSNAKFEDIFETEPSRLILASEPQSEGIAYSLDGDSLLTISEKRPTTLYEVKRVSKKDAAR